MYKLIVFSLLLLGVACSQGALKDKSKQPCSLKDNKIQDRHVVMSAKSHTKSLSRCFKHYMKFETEKKQSFNVCSVLNVAKSGKVTYSKVYGIGKRIPKDFKMCLEQEYWMMNFSKLQLETQAYIQFSLQFKSE